MPTEGDPAQRVREGLEAENSHWHLYPGALPVGLFIVGESAVVLGAKTPKVVVGDSGTAFYSDPEIVDWAINHHDEYLEESSEPLEHVIERITDESRELLNSVSPDSF